MGAQQSQPSDANEETFRSGITDLQKNFTKEGEVNDGRYGQIRILRSKSNGQLFCEMVKTQNTQQTYEAKIKECEFKKRLRHPNIVQLQDFAYNKNEQFCSSFWKVSMLYEYVNHDLRREITQRSKKGRIFSDFELWYLISSVVGALIFYKKNQFQHGDVRPYTILITPEGEVKLAENYQFNRHLNGYSQVLMELRDELYLTPQMMSFLKVKLATPKVDIHKVEVYALGLTVLEAALL